MVTSTVISTVTNWVTKYHEPPSRPEALFGMFPPIVTVLNKEYNRALLSSLLRAVSIRGEHPKALYSKLVHLIELLLSLRPFDRQKAQSETHLFEAGGSCRHFLSAESGLESC